MKRDLPAGSPGTLVDGAPAGATASADATTTNNAAALATRRRARSAAFLKWLRLTHLYLGLWGAALGLLFGITGVLLNHRAILKIPLEKAVQSTAQLALPAAGIATPDELSSWLQAELKLTPTQPVLPRSEPEKTVVWGDQEVRQPERWSVGLHSPQRGVNAEYFVGNRFVRVTNNDATAIGMLTRLHMASGVNAFWVLLSDTVAGALVMLSITGLLLWTQLRRVRTIAVLTSIGALLAATGFVSASL